MSHRAFKLLAALPQFAAEANKLASRQRPYRWLDPVPPAVREIQMRRMRQAAKVRRNRIRASVAQESESPARTLFPPAAEQ